MATILVQKDPKTMIPMSVTTQQRALLAQKFTIYDVDATNSRGPAVGPTNVGGSQTPAAGLQPNPGPVVIDISADYTLTADDNGKSFRLTTAATVTLPSTVFLPDGVIIDPPTSGNLSVASDGTTTLNGATTTLTRTAANNSVGVAVRTPRVAGVAGVSGS